MIELFNQVNNLDLAAFRESYNLIFYVFGLPLFVLFTIKEVYLQRTTKKSYIDVNELITDFSFFVMKALVGFINNAFILYIHLFFWDYRIMEFKMDGVMSAVLYFVITDLIYYLIHLYSHKVKLGWLTHFIHHSLVKLNALSAMRLGYTTIISCAWLVAIPFIVLGFHPLWIHLWLFVLAAYQVWLHTETIRDMPILDKFFNTPENHRLHHSTVAAHRNKNLGGILMIWDHLFGTYMKNPGKEHIIYGVGSVSAKGLGHKRLLIESFKVLKN